MTSPSTVPAPLTTASSTFERLLLEVSNAAFDCGECDDGRLTAKSVILKDARRAAESFVSSLESAVAALREDRARMDYLQECLGDGSEGSEEENVSLWRDYEVPEGVEPSYAISGFWCGNDRGTSLRKAIDAARGSRSQPVPNDG